MGEFKDEKRVVFSISTNGILLEKYADFLKQNRIMLAISLDGPRDVHDKNRITTSGKTTFDTIMKGIDKLGREYVKRKVSFSATITSQDDFGISYRFFRDNFPSNGARLEFVKTTDRKDENEERLKIPKKVFSEMLNDYEKGIKEKNVPRVLRFLFDDSFYRINSRPGEYDSSIIMHNRTCIPGARKLFVKPNGIFTLVKN